MKTDQKERRRWEREVWKDDGREEKDRGDKLLMHSSLSPHIKVESFFFIPLLLSNIIKHINLVWREMALRGSCGGVREREDD